MVVLGSGRGSNAEAILQAEKSGQLGTALVVGILSDVPNAGILEHGENFGKISRYIDPAPFRTKLEGEGEKRFIAAIEELRPDLVVLAGFMRVLKNDFLARFAGKIVNLHPSLLPSFSGLDAIGQAWRRGVRFSGCTVHGVTAEVDAGPILDQVVVEIAQKDSLVSFTEKIHAAEHGLLPSVIARISTGEISSSGFLKVDRRPLGAPRDE